MQARFTYTHDANVPLINLTRNSLKNAACSLQFSSYRGTFEISRGTWQTVRLPWSIFQGYGAGTEGVEFDPSSLRRLGVVAIGRAMEVNLALGGVRFYSVF